jgi:3-deoxy-7-phosphoheptulonate synthase
MSTTVTDVRIRSVRPLISPAILEDELPLSEAQASRIQAFRRQVADIVMGRDDRLLVLVGPCSVHDTQAALEYANRLLPLAEELSKAPSSA